MSDQFFKQPILNSPYAYPRRYWELDFEGQPTQKVIDDRRPAQFITPIPKPKKRKISDSCQQEFTFDEGKGISTEQQQYDPTSVINAVRKHVDEWRSIPDSSKWRDPGEEPKLHLFGQLKRITKEWLDTCLICKGGTYPAQLMYQEIADVACERIMAAITTEMMGTNPIKAMIDPYNPVGSTIHVRFNTSKKNRWETAADKSHINWVVLDSDWEAEFCRVAESHPKVFAYVKNHGLGLEVPYKYGSETRRYLPDFIVKVDDGRGPDDLLNLIVEIKGYRREDAKDKKITMDTYWVPGVNNLGKYGRWAFAEFTDVFEMETDFAKCVEEEFDKMICAQTGGGINNEI